MVIDGPRCGVFPWSWLCYPPVTLSLWTHSVQPFEGTLTSILSLFTVRIIPWYPFNGPLFRIIVLPTVSYYYVVWAPIMLELIGLGFFWKFLRLISLFFEIKLRLSAFYTETPPVLSKESLNTKTNSLNTCFTWHLCPSWTPFKILTVAWFLISSPDLFLVAKTLELIFEPKSRLLITWIVLFVSNIFMLSFRVAKTTPTWFFEVEIKSSFLRPCTFSSQITYPLCSYRLFLFIFIVFSLSVQISANLSSIFRMIPVLPLFVPDITFTLCPYLNLFDILSSKNYTICPWFYLLLILTNALLSLT